MSSSRDLIARFRNQKPTSRIERGKMSTAQQTWWAETGTAGDENDDDNGDPLHDSLDYAHTSISHARVLSPAKPSVLRPATALQTRTAPLLGDRLISTDFDDGGMLSSPPRHFKTVGGVGGGGTSGDSRHRHGGSGLCGGGGAFEGGVSGGAGVVDDLVFGDITRLSNSDNGAGRRGGSSGVDFENSYGGGEGGVHPLSLSSSPAASPSMTKQKRSAKSTTRTTKTTTTKTTHQKRLFRFTSPSRQMEARGGCGRSSAASVEFGESFDLDDSGIDGLKGVSGGGGGGGGERSLFPAFGDDFDYERSVNRSNPFLGGKGVPRGGSSAESSAELALRRRPVNVLAGMMKGFSTLNGTKSPRKLNDGGNDRAERADSGEGGGKGGEGPTAAEASAMLDSTLATLNQRLHGDGGGGGGDGDGYSSSLALPSVNYHDFDDSTDLPASIPAVREKLEANLLCFNLLFEAKFKAEDDEEAAKKKKKDVELSKLRDELRRERVERGMDDVANELLRKGKGKGKRTDKATTSGGGGGDGGGGKDHVSWSERMFGDEVASDSWDSENDDDDDDDEDSLGEGGGGGSGSLRSPSPASAAKAVLATVAERMAMIQRLEDGDVDLSADFNQGKPPTLIQRKEVLNASPEKEGDAEEAEGAIEDEEEGEEGVVAAALTTTTTTTTTTMVHHRHEEEEEEEEEAEVTQVDDVGEVGGAGGAVDDLIGDEQVGSSFRHCRRQGRAVHLSPRGPNQNHHYYSRDGAGNGHNDGAGNGHSNTGGGGGGRRRRKGGGSGSGFRSGFNSFSLAATSRGVCAELEVAMEHMHARLKGSDEQENAAIQSEAKVQQAALAEKEKAAKEEIEAERTRCLALLDAKMDEEDAAQRALWNQQHRPQRGGSSLGLGEQGLEVDEVGFDGKVSSNGNGGGAPRRGGGRRWLDQVARTEESVNLSSDLGLLRKMRTQVLAQQEQEQRGGVGGGGGGGGLGDDEEIVLANRRDMAMRKRMQRGEEEEEEEAEEEEEKRRHLQLQLQLQEEEEEEQRPTMPSFPPSRRRPPPPPPPTTMPSFSRGCGESAPQSRYDDGAGIGDIDRDVNEDVDDDDDDDDLAVARALVSAVPRSKRHQPLVKGGQFSFGGGGEAVAAAAAAAAAGRGGSGGEVTAARARLGEFRQLREQVFEDGGGGAAGGLGGAGGGGGGAGGVVSTAKQRLKEFQRLRYHRTMLHEAP